MHFPVFLAAAAATMSIATPVAAAMTMEISARDQSLVVLRTLFGDLFGAGQQVGGTTILAELSATISGWILGAGALWMTITVVRMVVDSAATGVPLGRSTNKFWMPIRFVAGFAMLIPLPGGWSVLQHLIATVTMLAIGFANLAWSQMSDALFRQATPMTAVSTPDVRHLAKWIAEARACEVAINWIWNRDYYRGEVAEFVSAIQVTEDLGKIDPQTGITFHEYRFDPTPAARARDISLPNGVCGSITFAVPNGEVDGVATRIAAAHRRALNELLSSPAPMELAKELLRSTRGFGPASAKPVAFDATPFLAMQSAYSKILADGISQALSNEAANRNDLQAQAETITSGGWAMAGAYYLQLARTNAEFHAAVSAMPSVTSPNWYAIRHNKSHLLEIYGAVLDVGAGIDEIWEQVDPAWQPDLTTLRARAIGSGSDIQVTAIQDRLAEARNRLQTVATTGVKDGKGRPRLKTRPQAKESIGHWGQVTDLAVKIRHIALEDIGALNEDASLFGGGDNVFLANPIGYLQGLGQRILALAGVSYTAAAVVEAASLGVLSATASWIMSAITILLLPAFFLAIVIPLLPAFYWFTAVVNWLLLVVEALVITPLWALAHLQTSGDSPIGDMAQRGWAIVFLLLVRPVLQLAGFVAGSVLFAAGALFAIKFFGLAIPALSAGLNESGGEVGAGFLLIFVLVVALTVLAERSFSLIHVIPDNAGKWIPFAQSSGIGDQDDNARYRALVLAGAHHGAGAVGAGGKALQAAGRKVAPHIKLPGTPTARITEQ